MIARIWTGLAGSDRVEAYVAHLREKTFPALRALAGHGGAYVLRRRADPRLFTSDVQVAVITLWESIDAIAGFAGDDVEAAVVPPEAQALLRSWDTRAVHWEVAYQELTSRRVQDDNSVEEL
jgi:hypothetical protein